VRRGEERRGEESRGLVFTMFFNLKAQTKSYNLEIETKKVG
jgi:hypothetical protein